MLMFQMFHVTLQTEHPLINRQMPTQRVLELRVRPPEPKDGHQTTPLNLALVLDRSGSMAGEKLEYVKLAARHVIDLLSSRDRVAVVSFDDEVTVDVPSTIATPDNRERIKERIAAIVSGASTNLAGGWTVGCQEVAANAETSRQLNRVLLLTDGLANVGITDSEMLAAHARELAQRGVSTSTFGVGLGFNEHLLEGMANQGSGNFYYIADPSQIPMIFAREFRELAAVTARDVRVNVILPEHTAAEVLGGWEHRLEDNHLHITLGNLPAARDTELYIKLLLPPSDNVESLQIKAFANGTGTDGNDLSDETTLAFRYANPEEIAQTESKIDVLERFARVQMSDQTTSALKLERKGEREKARRLILQSLEENRVNMTSDQARYYEDMAERMSHGMHEDDRKSTQYASYLRKRGREDSN